MPCVCRLRDLNDEINKLIREKGHWERRIVELGGPDYSKTGPKATDSEGNELINATGKGLGYRWAPLILRHHSQMKPLSCTVSCGWEAESRMHHSASLPACYLARQGPPVLSEQATARHAILGTLVRHFA